MSETEMLPEPEEDDSSKEVILIKGATPVFNGDLYAALGLKQGTVFSTLEITKAYRKLIGKYHPDRIKQTEQTDKELKQIQLAYDVLSNEESRRFYDETGVLPITQVEIEKHGDQLCNDRLTAICNELCGDSNSITPESLAKFDLVDQAEKTFSNDLKRNLQVQNNIGKVIKKLKVVIKRLSKKKGNFRASPVGNQLHRNLKESRTALGNSINERKVIKQALVQIKDFTYEVEVEPKYEPGSNWGQTTTVNYTSL